MGGPSGMGWVPGGGGGVGPRLLEGPRLVCPRSGLVGTRGNGGGKGVTPQGVSPKVVGRRGIGLRGMPLGPTP